jgi:hypothetical protein
VEVSIIFLYRQATTLVKERVHDHDTNFPTTVYKTAHTYTHTV